MENRYDNCVIKALNKEHGKKVIQWWKDQGVNTRDYVGSQTAETHGDYYYYGLANGYFDNFRLSWVENQNLKIIEPPELAPKKAKKPKKKRIDRVTTDRLDLVFKMVGLEIEFDTVDKIIDCVELIEDKGGKISLDDISKLQSEWGQ